MTNQGSRNLIRLSRRQVKQIVETARKKGERPDLSGVNLVGQSLIGATFGGTDLSGANRSLADLCGADLSQADLSGINLNGAKYNQDTKWPKGFDPIKARAIGIRD
jgi:uncharacterized protein YjbI with pentapeptide repeats